MAINYHQVIAQNNLFAVTVGVGAPSPANYSQGLIVDDDGAVYASTGPITQWQNGLPFDAFGRLVVEDGPVAFYDQGTGFTASGALAVANQTTVDHYNQGLPMESSGAIGGSGLGPPPLEPYPPAPPSVAANVLSYAIFGAPTIQFYRLDISPYGEITPITDETIAQALACKFNSDVNQWVVGGGSPFLEAWDTTTYPFTKIVIPVAPGNQVNCLAFNSDGSRLFVGTAGNFVDRVYNTADYSSVATSEAFQSTDCDISRNDQYLVVASNVNTSRLYNFLVSPPVQVTPPSPWVGNATACAFHPTLGLLLMGTSVLTLYDLATFTSLGTVTAFEGGQVNSIRFNRTGSKVQICYSAGANIQVLSLVTPTNPASWTVDTTNDTTELSGDVRGGAWAGDDALFSLCNPGVAPRQAVWDSVAPPYERVADFDASDTTNNYASAFLDGVVLPPPPIPGSNAVIFAYQGSPSLYQYRLDTTPWSSVSLVTDNVETNVYATAAAGTYFAAAGETTQPVQVWNIATTPFTKLTPPASLGTRVIDLAFSPSGVKLLAATEGALVNRLYTALPNLATFSDLNVFAATKCAFSKFSENYLAVVGPGSPFLQTWNVTGAPVLLSQLANWPNQPVYGVDFHPASEYVCAGGNNPPRVWDLIGGTDLGALPGTWGITRSIKFSNGGAYCATYDSTNGLRIWNVVSPFNPASWTLTTLATATPGIDNALSGCWDWSNNDAFLVCTYSGGSPNQRAYNIAGGEPFALVANFSPAATNNRGAAFITGAILP